MEARSNFVLATCYIEVWGVEVQYCNMVSLLGHKNYFASEASLSVHVNRDSWAGGWADYRRRGIINGMSAQK